jgi:hypothetical protein
VSGGDACFSFLFFSVHASDGNDSLDCGTFERSVNAAQLKQDRSAQAPQPGKKLNKSQKKKLKKKEKAKKAKEQLLEYVFATLSVCASIQ